MTLSRIVTCLAVVLAVGVSAPAEAANFKFNKPVNGLNDNLPKQVRMTQNECTQLGGRVVKNIACYSGLQCRGAILQDCIDKKK